MMLLAESHTTETIAAFLGITGKTVQYHRINLKRSLGVRTLGGLTMVALRVGLIEP
jgi:DNA-binding CsgD family transcriptional regulator